MPAACYHHAVSNIQVKDVPEQIHEELRRRAGQLSMSIRDYVLDLLRRDQALPSRADWLDELRASEPVDIGAPAAEAIRESRRARAQRR